MVDITPLIKGNPNIIESYGAGRFIISKKEYLHSVIFSPSHLEQWQVETPLTWNQEFLDTLLAHKKDAETIILGTGEKSILPPSTLRQNMRDSGLNCDVMDTGAACRTYNVLLSEERRVLAALVVI